MNIYIPAIGENEGIIISPQIFACETYMDNVIISGNIDSEIEEAVFLSITLLLKMGITIPRYLHIHFNDYNYNKRGISASLGIFFALFTAIRKVKYKFKYMMTGEIDILGNIYEIGQIEEKIKLFLRSDCDYMFVPLRNDGKIYSHKNVFKVSKIEDIFEVISSKEEADD